MKNVKVIKTRTAIIIFIIEVILIMFAVFVCIEKYYQKEYETFPTISVYYGNSIIAEMLPIEYTWEYKGEEQKYNLNQDLETYEFPEENTAFIGMHRFDDYILKSNIRYKTASISGYNYYVRDALLIGGARSKNNGDFSKSFKRGRGIEEYNGIGEHIYLTNINYVKQGIVNYALKVITFDEEQAKIAKDYLNTSISDNVKINELLTKITFSSIYQSSKIDGKNLILEYDHHIGKDALKMNNLVLFTCIPELETVTYSPKNKKTVVTEIRDEQVFEENKEIDKYVYTREEVNNEDLANIENLKKFMEQI